MQVTLDMNEISDAIKTYVAGKYNMSLHTIHLYPIDGVFEGQRFKSHIAELNGVRLPGIPPPPPAPPPKRVIKEGVSISPRPKVSL